MDKIYRIIWADDEIDALLDENSKALLSKQHVEVIKCNNAAMLEEKLKNVNHRIDAVIVDANFTARDFTPSNETVVSGLRKAMMLIGEYKHLPFYLYTQRVNLSDLVDEEELSYFKDDNAIFFKGNGLLPLLDRIKNDVDKYNSAEFQIDNQFKKELSDCKKFDNHCKKFDCNGNSYNTIRSLLIKNQENDLQDSEKHLNEFRTLLENMNTVAEKFGIVPEELSLNEFSKFLCRHKDSKFLVNEDILPKALYEILFYVIRLVQDGSHDRPDLQYRIRRYIHNTHDVLIIRSILFAVIEIITWFTRYVEEHPDKEENQKRYIKVDETEGIIEQDEKGYCHINNKYSVLIRNRDLIGKKVKILNSKENTSSSTKKYYPLFVREEDLQLLENSENGSKENGTVHEVGYLEKL